MRTLAAGCRGLAEPVFDLALTTTATDRVREGASRFVVDAAASGFGSTAPEVFAKGSAAALIIAFGNATLAVATGRAKPLRFAGRRRRAARRDVLHCRRWCRRGGRRRRLRQRSRLPRGCTTQEHGHKHVGSLDHSANNTQSTPVTIAR